tara:strand:+ start:11111 stop:11908 length:798 start_codon:yes stop_codon:yes gene_type:complete
MKKDINNLEAKIHSLIKTGRLMAIKAEFEAEGTRIDELGLLSNICFKNNVPLTLKTGGPAAIRDIFEAFQLSAKNILIPMIESSYSLEYFIISYNKFLNDFQDLNIINKLSINIESKLGYKNIGNILQLIEEKSLPISHIVIGRTDLSSSLKITDVNSEEILNIAKDIITKASRKNVKCTIGGNLSSDSFEFINYLKDYKLEAFESRKATFKLTNSLTKKEFDNLIQLGLEFELAWLNLKRKMYNFRSEEENTRIQTIKSRLIRE